VRITYTYRGGCEELIVALAYLPYGSDEPPPTKEIRDIIDYYQTKKKQLIFRWMPVHTILCGEAAAPTREQKGLRNFW
jgi:hypothetical protein